MDQPIRLLVDIFMVERRSMLPRSKTSRAGPVGAAKEEKERKELIRLKHEHHIIDISLHLI